MLSYLCLRTEDYELLALGEWWKQNASSPLWFLYTHIDNKKYLFIVINKNKGNSALSRHFSRTIISLASVGSHPSELSLQKNVTGAISQHIHSWRFGTISISELSGMWGGVHPHDWSQGHCRWQAWYQWHGPCQRLCSSKSLQSLCKWL